MNYSGSNSLDCSEESLIRTLEIYYEQEKLVVHQENWFIVHNMILILSNEYNIRKNNIVSDISATYLHTAF
jgi:hypothetical protein